MLKHVSGLALGVVSAIGGFVDFGGVISGSAAGAQYQFALLWTLIPGVIGFAVYADMAGRVTIASGRTLFDVIRDRLGFRLALIPLIATTIVNIMTLVYELAGMGLVLQAATHLSYLLWFPLAAGFVAVVLWTVRFDVLENVAAVMGLAMLVTAVALVKLAPPWGAIGRALVHPAAANVHPLPAYLFAAIGLLGAYMTPYEFVFYSSGAVEERWGGADLMTNRVVSIVGTVLGAVILLALMATNALVVFPHHGQINSLLDATRATAVPLGAGGLVVFLFGVFAVSLLAGLEVALAGSYTICQYFGWDWGKGGKPRAAPAFHFLYLLLLAAAVAVAFTGVDPVQMTTYALAFAAFALPFAFFPLLIVANDRDFVGEQRNPLAVNVVAVLVLLLLTAVTLATIPLLILSGGGG